MDQGAFGFGEHLDRGAFNFGEHLDREHLDQGAFGPGSIWTREHLDWRAFGFGEHLDGEHLTGSIWMGSIWRGAFGSGPICLPITHLAHKKTNTKNMYVCTYCNFPQLTHLQVLPGLESNPHFNLVFVNLTL